MKAKKWLIHTLMAATYLSVSLASSVASDQSSQAESTASVLTFHGVDYEHRWSKDGQNEFTPKGQADLNAWVDMVTINVNDKVSTGDQLAALANGVLGTYSGNGKVLRTHSKPQEADSPAEHLVVAVLGASNVLEAAFARFVMVDGVGVIAVYSHRIYGANAGPEMTTWIRSNASQVDSALMAWAKLPKPGALKRLPQSD
ncbi:hypothetical protein LPB72_10730 [Hydrogenophaga crassostreae]|uniref:Uncharacterized protein n=1 Tax=Hydrogenophaga crassostreae TaxID=1763535 RepID=A0A167HV58_9BURK|nr:hypothetical protein [Hydrogenophaga crassostreae]AOW13489.1 hypothetical protein LPB072_12105 [Hydrogenophaga crassostreae]OAD41780.1 hypothetical protein LPB72_10730 [Hydrogenophaga crassostreae]